MLVIVWTVFAKGAIVVTALGLFLDREYLVEVGAAEAVVGILLLTWRDYCGAFCTGCYLKRL